MQSSTRITINVVENTSVQREKLPLWQGLCIDEEKLLPKVPGKCVHTMVKIYMYGHKISMESSAEKLPYMLVSEISHLISSPCALRVWGNPATVNPADNGAIKEFRRQRKNSLAQRRVKFLAK